MCHQQVPLCGSREIQWCGLLEPASGKLQIAVGGAVMGTTGSAVPLSCVCACVQCCILETTHHPLVLLLRSLLTITSSPMYTYLQEVRKQKESAGHHFRPSLFSETGLMYISLGTTPPADQLHYLIHMAGGKVCGWGSLEWAGMVCGRVASEEAGQV